MAIKVDPTEYDFIPPQAEHAYFETHRGAWILTYTTHKTGADFWTALVVIRGDVSYVSNQQKTFGRATGPAKLWINKHVRIGEIS